MCAKAGPEVRATDSYFYFISFEVVGVDYLSLGCPGDLYILIMTDLFSMYVLAVPTRDQSADTTAKALYNNLIQTFGCPERILTDGGGFQILGDKSCSNYMVVRRAEHCITGNGVCERFNQTQLLSSLSETDQEQWPQRLPVLHQAYNNTIHRKTRMIYVWEACH